MRTLQSRPYVVKTIRLAKRRTLAKKFHRSAGTEAGNAAVAAACQAAAGVIFLPVSIVPGSIGGISAHCTSKARVLPMKITSPGCALTPSRIPIARADPEFACPGGELSDAAVVCKHGTPNRSAGGASGIEAGHWQQTFGNRGQGRRRVGDLAEKELVPGLRSRATGVNEHPWTPARSE